jgi:hypothetical protein
MPNRNHYGPSSRFEAGQTRGTRFVTVAGTFHESLNLAQLWRLPFEHIYSPES